VVAADEVHALWVAQLEADEERDGLDAEEAAVDVVACDVPSVAVLPSLRRP
jgi:hypothetical protein